MSYVQCPLSYLRPSQLQVADILGVQLDLVVRYKVFLQADGFQLKVCICTWHLCITHAPHQHVAQADTADMAVLQGAQGEVERQGMANAFGCI